MESKLRAKKYTTGGITFPRHFSTPMDFVIFDQANDAMILHDACTGVIIKLNQKACDLFGYTLTEIRKQKKVAVYAGASPYTEEEALKMIKKAAAGEPQLFEWKTKTGHGSEFWCEISLKKITIQNRGVVLAIIRDITRRRITLQNLQVQHNYLSLLQETGLAIMNRLNLNDLLTSVITYAGTLLGTSHGFIYMTNDEKSQLELKVSTSLQGNFLSPQLKQGEDLVGKIWQTGKPLFISDYQAWKGRTAATPDYVRAMAGVPLKSDSKVVGVIGLCYLDNERTFKEDEEALLNRFSELASVALDNARLYSTVQNELTERKHAEQALRLSEERYRLLFNCVHDAIYVTTITDDCFPDRIIEANATTCEQMGYTREELLQMSLADLIPLEYRGDMQEQVELLYAQKQILFETAHLTKSGQSIPMEVHSHLIFLDEQPCILSIVRDITERKRVGKEISRLDRINLIGAMASGIGHEIRNPLTTARGYLQILTEAENDQNNIEHYELIIKELDRINSVITDFLSLAKTKAVDMKDGNLNSVMDILLPLLEAGAILYQKNIKADLGDIPDIPLDEKEIRQLILNLVRNGLDVMPPGGTLTIKTYSIDREVIFSVQDQGTGIPPDIVDKIGTPFFSTKEHGVGLGLAVCYSIAARHNGFITFDSQSSGTTVYVHFKTC